MAEAAPVAKAGLSGLNGTKLYEGNVVKVLPTGVLVDIGIQVPGLLRWKSLKGVPRKMCQKGCPLANLRVHQVNYVQLQFELHLKGVGQGFDTFEEDDYDDIVSRVFHWAREDPSAVDPGHVQVVVPQVGPGVKGRRGRNGPRNILGATPRPPAVFSISRLRCGKKGRRACSRTSRLARTGKMGMRASC